MNRFIHENNQLFIEAGRKHGKLHVEVVEMK